MRLALVTPLPDHAPVDYITAEPGEFTDDEVATAILELLERIAEAAHVVDESHVVRCAGCGGWAWDEHPCSTCCAGRRHARARARGVARERAGEKSAGVVRRPPGDSGGVPARTVVAQHG